MPYEEPISEIDYLNSNNVISNPELPILPEI